MAVATGSFSVADLEACGPHAVFETLEDTERGARRDPGMSGPAPRLTVTTSPDIIPELGPSLGRLVDPPPALPGALRVPLDDIRIDLVTGVFELAGAGRSFAAAGDRESAMASLGRVAWLGLWEKAVATAAGRIAGGGQFRLSNRRRRNRAIRRGGSRDTCSPMTIPARSPRGSGAGGRPSWPRSMRWSRRPMPARRRGPPIRRAENGGPRSAATARRLEAAWMALEDVSRAEQQRWAAEVAAVQAWHRPTWPVWLVTVVVVGCAVYLGLVLGGYLPVPPPLQGLATLVVDPAVNVIGVGVDLVDLERIARLLADKGEQAMQRFFTDGERAYLGHPPGAHRARGREHRGQGGGLQGAAVAARSARSRAGGRSRWCVTLTAGRPSGSMGSPHGSPRNTGGWPCRSRSPTPPCRLGLWP